MKRDADNKANFNRPRPARMLPQASRVSSGRVAVVGVTDMEYKVATFRAAGLEAKWGKHNGTPFILLRNPATKLAHQRNTWWTCDRDMFERMEKVGIIQGFEEHTLLGDVFAI